MGIKFMALNEIKDLPARVRVVLLRRTGPNTVKADVGYRVIRNEESQYIDWFCKNPPTHWVELPLWGEDKA